MEKSFILRRAGQFFKMEPDDSLILKKELEEYAKQRESLTSEELATSIIKDFPHLQILHNASMRRYARVSANNSSVMKVIIVIYLIASIIVGLSFL